MDKVKDKLEKLIRLRDGALDIGSLEEAENASRRITEMLLKYNLAEHQLNPHKENNSTDSIILEPDNESEMGWSKNEAMWTSFLLSGIAKNNMCMVIVDTWVKPPSYTIIGDKINIETVVFLWKQLVPKIRNLAKRRWGEVKDFSHEKRNTFLRGYFRGCTNSIVNRLKDKNEEFKKQNSNMTGLMVINNDRIQIKLKEIESQIGETKKKTQKTTKSQLGRRIGQKDGKEMTINKGLTGNPLNQNKVG